MLAHHSELIWLLTIATEGVVVGAANLAWHVLLIEMSDEWLFVLLRGRERNLVGRVRVLGKGDSCVCLCGLVQSLKWCGVQLVCHILIQSTMMLGSGEMHWGVTWRFITLRIVGIKLLVLLLMQLVSIATSLVAIGRSQSPAWVQRAPHSPIEWKLWVHFIWLACLVVWIVPLMHIVLLIDTSFGSGDNATIDEGISVRELALLKRWMVKSHQICTCHYVVSDQLCLIRA